MSGFLSLPFWQPYAAYMSKTRIQKRFTISEVAADWHELMILQRIMRPPVARAAGGLECIVSPKIGCYRISMVYRVCEPEANGMFSKGMVHLVCDKCQYAQFLYPPISNLHTREPKKTLTVTQPFL